MKTMTPYSLAFTVFRLVAVYFLFVAIYDMIVNAPQVYLQKEKLEFFLGFSLAEIAKGALAYFVAPYLARITLWRLRE
jgi:hypothetical protein